MTETTPKESNNPRRRRSGGRNARHDARKNTVERIAPYIQRNVPVFNLLSEEGLELIERNADTLLEEIGIEFRGDEEVLKLWKEAGADLAGERVRFPKNMCRSILKKSAPSEFTQHARNPEKNVVIGGNNMVLVPAYGPPFIRNLDDGRRYGTLQDFQNFVKLTYMSASLHHSGGTLCEPVDLPVNKRHFDMIGSHIKYSDKPFMGSVTAPERAQDTVDMAKVIFGDDFVENHCVIISLINANSPLVFDATMLGAAKVYAKHNQATIISPFILAGAMSPVTVVGTCAQILAEVLAGAALTQLIRPGAPVVFGTFASSISMKTGAPTFGSPEPSMVTYITAELARRLQIPYRSGGGLCSSKISDAQAAYEAANTLQTAMFAGVNFMLHTAGWLEGGLAMGYEKFIMDADQAGMIQKFLAGVDCSENGQALEALREVGPGNHFLGCNHTQANFETAFYMSNVADNNSYEQWKEEGSQDATKRANAIWKTMLNEYEIPPLDPSKEEALQEFIEKRKASFPDSNV